MNSPKRKVTDLLPSEAIRVSPSQDGRVFDIEPIPTEAEKVEVLSKAMITIGMDLDANTALRIAKVLAQYEPEIWKEIKQEIRQVKIKTRNPETK